MTKWHSLLLASALGVAFLGPASAAHNPPGSPVSEARYRVGDVELAGELFTPSGNGPFPSVVIAQGSGSSGRDNLWARSAAKMLSDMGLLVLLTDKRGSGQSGGDWRDIGIAERATDILAGVDFLARHHSAISKCVGLFGLSQGGRVVPVAAARSDGVAFLVNASGDLVSFPEQIVHEMRNEARNAGLSEDSVRRITAIATAATGALFDDDWEPYLAMIEAAHGQEWETMASGFPAPEWDGWQFYRESLTFDSMPYWVGLDQPALILLGADDEEQNVAVDESLRRLAFMQEVTGKTNIRAHRYPGLGHLLGWTNSEPFDARLQADLAGFLSQVPCIAEARGERG